MPKRKRKTVSDSYLTKLARQASLKIWGCCLMCGNANWNQLDVHHFVHKGGHKLLRWDWKNLFPLCSSRYNTCHQEADTIKGKPVMIVADTIKSKGVPFAEGKAQFHHGIMTEEQHETARKLFED